MEILKKRIFGIPLNYLILIFGFGIAFLLWGLDVYLGIKNNSSSFVDPFYHILGVSYLGLIGGASLLVFVKNKKEVIKTLSLNFFGWLIAFIVTNFLSYILWLFGGTIFILPEVFLNNELLEQYTSIGDSLSLSYLWLEFFVAGLIVSIFYLFLPSFSLKIRSLFKIPLVLSLGVIVAPILGNVVGNIFGKIFPSSSLIIVSLFSFFIIGLSFALGLIWAIKDKKGVDAK